MSRCRGCLIFNRCDLHGGALRINQIDSAILFRKAGDFKMRVKELTILLTLFLCTTIYSQNNFYITGNSGINLSYPKSPLNKIWGTSYNLGVGFGYNFTEEISSELTYQYNKHKLSAISYDGNANDEFINSIILRINYSFLNTNSLNPFLGFGIGFSNYKSGEKKVNGILSLFPAVGIRYKATERIGIKLLTEFAYLDFNYIDESLKYFPVQLAVQYDL